QGGMPSMVYFLANPSEKVRWEAQQPRPAQPAAKSGPAVAPALGAGERLRFDADHVEVREDGKHQWRLMFGRQELANFGTDQHLAKQALQLLQHYHFTDQMTIGSPETGFRYFLTNGQAPVGVRFGVQAQPFRPDGLLVRQ